MTKDWMVRFTVEAPPEEVNRLKALLHDTLEGAGFTMTTGSTFIEAWMVRETEKLRRQPGLSGRGSGYMAEHVSRTPKGMGRGPDSG